MPEKIRRCPYYWTSEMLDGGRTYCTREDKHVGGHLYEIPEEMLAVDTGVRLRNVESRLAEIERVVRALEAGVERPIIFTASTLGKVDPLATGEVDRPEEPHEHQDLADPDELRVLRQGEHDEPDDAHEEGEQEGEHASSMPADPRRWRSQQIVVELALVEEVVAEIERLAPWAGEHTGEARIYIDRWADVTVRGFTEQTLAGISRATAREKLRRGWATPFATKIVAEWVAKRENPTSAPRG